VWLTQKHLAAIFYTTKQNVSQHITQIIESGELEESSCVKKFFTVDEKFGRPAKIPVYHYNLDMIIALGYRIDSPVAIRFRQWATERLHELIQKGFALEDERLKQGGNRYFKKFSSAKARLRMMRQSPKRRRSSKSTAPVKCASSSPTSTRPSAGICEVGRSRNHD